MAIMRMTISRDAFVKNYGTDGIFRNERIVEMHNSYRLVVLVDCVLAVCASLPLARAA